MTPDLFTVRWTDADGVRHLELSGELDLSNVADLESAFEQCADHKRVVVDATRLEFIDSTGLHALIDGRNQLGEDRFVLVPGRTLDRLLDITGVKKLFRLE
jgi:anti-anti-sigma factor